MTKGDRPASPLGSVPPSMLDAAPAYASIQALRFIAALMVVLCHVTFYVRERLAPASYFYNLGANGVALFFVISGFVMIVATQGAGGREANWRAFGLKRIIRIVPMYWLATTVKLCVLLAGAGLVLHARFDPAFIVKSYFFIPAVNAEGRIEPLLGVGWTLMFEMLFYAIFSLALAVKRDPFVVCSAAFGGLYLLSLVKTPAWPAVGLFASPLGLEFVWGMLIAKFVRTGFGLPPFLCLVGILAGGISLFAPRLGVLTLLPQGDLIFGLSAALVILGCVGLEQTRQLKVPPILTWLGAASYSLYLFHPLIAPAVPALMHRVGITLTGLAIGTSACIAIAAGSAIYALVERPMLEVLRALLAPALRRPTSDDHGPLPGQTSDARLPRRRVAFDAHVLCGKPQGSATALRQHLRALAQMALPFEVIIYGEDIAAMAAQIGPSDFSYVAIPRSGSLKRLLIDLPRRLKDDRVDLGVFQFIAPPLSATPSVIVMHDLLPFTHKHLFPVGFRVSRQVLFAQALRRARGIVTISDFTRSEILRLFPRQTVEPIVAYNGPSFAAMAGDGEGLRSAVSEMGPIDGRFILCVGRIEIRKNVDLLVEAFIKAHLIDVKLVIVGTQDLGFAWQPPPDPRIVHVSGLTEAALRDLYGRASLFVFPSQAEGFGIPLLDALMCGLPVISSDQTAMREVASGLARMFDPTRDDAAETLSRAIRGHFHGDPIPRPSKADRSELARRFSWAQSAKTLVLAIDEALSRP